MVLSMGSKEVYVKTRKVCAKNVLVYVSRGLVKFNPTKTLCAKNRKREAWYTIYIRFEVPVMHIPANYVELYYRTELELMVS